MAGYCGCPSKLNGLDYGDLLWTLSSSVLFNQKNLVCSDLNFLTTAGSEKCNIFRYKGSRVTPACDDVKNVKEEINAALNIRSSRTRICFTKLRV